MQDKKTVTFQGGPLDGKTKEVDSHVTSFELDAPPAPEDIHTGEIPVAFFPPFHSYIYEESTAGSNIFILKKDLHT